MFCCKSKKATRNKSQINPHPHHLVDHRTHSASLLDSPESAKKNPMFTKQSPHFSQIEITRTKKLKPIVFEEKTKLHCQFCGGKTCKHENWTRCANPAIDGLHSNWVNDNVIASQRLSDRLIYQYDIIGQFKKKGVNAVFNLQEPGEHPYCGDGINMKSGFSYSPELLMNNQIQFFNFYWKDLTNPTFERLLNAAQVMDFIIKSGGKCLVHCHAGQGRTALLIGAYLIISGTAKDDKECIQQTKKNRPKCFSKSYNTKFIKVFNDKFCDLKVLFPSPQSKLSLRDILNKQSLHFHGQERKYSKFIPKVVNQALLKVKQLTSQNQDFIIEVDEYKQLMEKNNEYLNNQIQQIRLQVNKDGWNAINSCDDVPTLNYIVVSFIQGLNKYILTQEAIEKIRSLDVSKIDHYLLGFFTAIADLCQILSQDIKDSSQKNEIFKFYADLIAQEQPQFVETIHKALIEIGQNKVQIYKLEEIKEANDISPIKMQLTNKQLANTGQNYYQDKISGRSSIDQTRGGGQRDGVNSVNLIQSSDKDNFSIEQRDPLREDQSMDTFQMSQKLSSPSQNNKGSMYKSQDGPLSPTVQMSEVKEFKESQLLPDIHRGSLQGNI